ncbi:MAG TPA: DUF4124 domain-containing protein [Steroidobacteraceae bacterium]|nr:DUF4124 domain-containing protein [Steroidobacteraceae bacterium]
MKNVAWILCLCAVLALRPGAAAPAPAKSPSNNGRVLYKWVDKDGVTHYGDHVPPEYATQEQHVLNSQGYEIRHQDAQKSAEQEAADEQKKLDAEQRQIRDKNLLSTYASVQEIERLRDQRLTLLADQIKVTGQFLETLNGRMKKMRADTLRFKPYSSDPKAPSMPDQVAEDLVRLTTDVRTQEQNLKQKRSEEATMSIQFESDIDRFKELKHIQ